MRHCIQVTEYSGRSELAKDAVTFLSLFTAVDTEQHRYVLQRLRSIDARLVGIGYQLNRSWNFLQATLPGSSYVDIQSELRLCPDRLPTAPRLPHNFWLDATHADNRLNLATESQCSPVRPTSSQRRMCLFKNAFFPSGPPHLLKSNAAPSCTRLLQHHDSAPSATHPALFSSNATPSSARLGRRSHLPQCQVTSYKHLSGTKGPASRYHLLDDISHQSSDPDALLPFLDLNTSLAKEMSLELATNPSVAMRATQLARRPAPATDGGELFKALPAEMLSMIIYDRIADDMITLVALSQVNKHLEEVTTAHRFGLRRNDWTSESLQNWLNSLHSRFSQKTRRLCLRCKKYRRIEIKGHRLRKDWVRSGQVFRALPNERQSRRKYFCPACATTLRERYGHNAHPEEWQEKERASIRESRF